jgi:type II secretory pathway pseudopilin PulG
MDDFSMLNLKQRGISLIEILVALASSSLLISLLMNQYIGIKRHYKQSALTIENTLDVQLVLDLIRDSVRQAGFTPCMSIDRLITTDMRDTNHPVSAIELDPNGAAGFQTNYMHPQFGIFMQPISPTTMWVTPDAKLSSHLPVLIADCYHAEVHTLHHLRHTEGHWEVELEHALTYTYQPPVYIAQWVESQFFMRSGVLYYEVGHAEALSSAIHSLSARLKNKNKQSLLRVAIGIREKKAIHVDTTIRSV